MTNVEVAERTWLEFGGVKITKKAAATIISTLLLVPGGGQYALSAFGFIDPSGSGEKASGQLQANVMLINLYESSIEDLKSQRDDAKTISLRLHDQLQSCHTTISGDMPIPDSALELIR